jgi:predicted dehydrogenase
MRRLRLAGIGCGGRTETYLGLAAQMPEHYEVVAAADPIPGRVEKIRQLARNPGFRGFDSDKAILAVDKLADIMVIGTQDAYHVAPCVAAMEKGYDILLEKPIATNIDEVIRLERVAATLKRKVLVCHVLRYTPFYQKVKEIVDSGLLGDVVSLNANEGVGAWHQGHSFVRGHWSVTEKATPMIIAKSCHDMDILSWIVGKTCASVSSYGSLTHFTSRNAPPGAPGRCTDGCPVGATCPYNALLYLGPERTWLTYVMDGAQTATDDQKRQWLSTSRWGRCVYRCDNTAVDHQVVNLAFEGGVTATFTMTAFENGRQIEIYGTRAKLRGGEFVKKTTDSDIIVTGLDHAWETRFGVQRLVGGYGGHGGGDAGLVLALYDEMMKADARDMLSSLPRSVESHVMGYAAEESRVSGSTIVLDEFRRRHGGS